MKTEVLELVIEGVRVRVRLDERGRPITVSSGCWAGGDIERITRLALDVATFRLQSAGEERKKAANDATRTAESTKVRRDKAKVHWSRKWLEDAHSLNPDLGAERLALAARKQVAANCKGKPEHDKRHEITEYRAKQYLKSVRTK